MPLKVGLIASALVAIVGWALTLLFPQRGLDPAGLVAEGGRWLAWAMAGLILAATVGGAVRRWTDGRLFDSGRSVDELSWAEFERYLAEYFRRHGNVVTHRGGALPDGGVDLVLEGGEGRRIVQAKHWKVRQVGVKPLRELWGVLGDERADGAVVVTSGGFTPEARAFARGKRLELIGGPELSRMVAEVKDRPATPATDSEACPQCGTGRLVKRLARRGVGAGSHFLGCSRYPECRYTRNL